VKKLLSIFAVFAAVLFVFGIVSRHTGASQNVFNTGSEDEREHARQISLAILRDRAAQRHSVRSVTRTTTSSSVLRSTS
jgi:hypothetical protein